MLSKIYTKTGDKGSSGLIGGTRVPKFDDRLEAYGTVDELNSWIGVLASQNEDDKVQTVLKVIQHKLFVVGSHLATDISKSDNRNQLPCDGNDILLLENEIDRMNAALPALTNFILPGGSTLSAQTHIARTVCRRAERRTAAIVESSKVHPDILKFINRLSDYLFVLARYFNHLSGKAEVLWEK